MNRTMFMTLSSLVTCATTLVPVAICVHIAQEDAHRREEEALRTFANNAILRVELVTHQATEAVREMERLPDARCSPAHMESMRRIAFTWRYVQDAGIYGNGANLCSALLGAVQDRHLRLPPPDWRSTGGFVGWFDLANPFGSGRKAVLIGRNGSYVSVDPSSYVDVVSRDAHLLAVVNTDTGKVFAVTPGADLALMTATWRRSGDVGHEDHLFVIKQSPDFPLAMVVEARLPPSLANWKVLLAVWLAVGLALGLPLGWLVWCLLSHQISMRGQLQRAVRRREFVVRYQPIVALADGRCVGAEALVRWVQHDRLVPPDLFIPLAEGEGLIQQITDQVLGIVIDELGEHLRRHTELYVSINLSAEDLKTRRFLNVLTTKLAGTGIANGQIRIEVTERGFMDADVTRDVIQAFRDAGHPVYIDDFGTGYSSLSYLQSFKVDVLKIDKSFVDTIAQEAASSSVASYIIAMACALGVEVVAEGIERTEQADFLREHGAQFGQGWLFAKPMQVAEYIRYLDQVRDVAHDTGCA